MFQKSNNPKYVRKPIAELESCGFDRPDVNQTLNYIVQACSLNVKSYRLADKTKGLFFVGQKRYAVLYIYSDVPLEELPQGQEILNHLEYSFGQEDKSWNVSFTNPHTEPLDIGLISIYIRCN